MRKIIVTEWVTLDGFIAGENGEMDWVTKLFDTEMGKYEDNIVSSADTLLLGRVTYDSFAGSWPKVLESSTVSAEEKEYAAKLNAMKKIVFSKSMEKADWNNSIVMNEINAEKINKLKQEEGKNILIYGSASIVQQLTELGLIDEYQLLVHPVALEKGKRLFNQGKHAVDLKFSQAKTFSSGVVGLYYLKV